jgi:hypothetical protein
MSLIRIERSRVPIWASLATMWQALTRIERRLTEIK